jgi:ADP-ribose pyrophosphatase YjhB (NUDIX family)
MGKQDILLTTNEGVFSYRVAGILIRDGKVLLQRVINDPAYAFPGGHVNFGETSEQAVIREFKEEIAADIRPIRLLWIGENFFPWGEKNCHQIGLYYLLALGDETQIPLDSIFYARDEVERKACQLEFSWVDLTKLKHTELYPIIAKEKLMDLSDHIEQFVYVENQ